MDSNVYKLIGELCIHFFYPKEVLTMNKRNKRFSIKIYLD